MSAIIIVDRKKRDDIHYRYKMPSIECKVESGGNGIKVVFSNLADVSAAIHRPPEALLKFLGIARGSQATFDAKDNKYYIMGNHPSAEVQDTVYDFIERYVLCKYCRNPETQVLPGKRTVNMRCGACGKETCLDSLDEKIVKELVKGSSQTKSETVRADTNIGAAAAAAAPVDSDIACMIDLTKEYVLPGESAVAKDPFGELFEALKDVKNLGRIGVQKRLIAIKSEHSINDDDVPRLIFRGATNFLIDNNQPFIASLRDASFLFKNLLDSCRSASDKVSSIQDTILHEVALRVINKDKAEKVPMVLKMLIDESVLEPAKVVSFCNSLETNATIKKKDQLPTLIEQSKVLVEWLLAGSAAPAEETPAEAPEAEAATAVAAKGKKSKKIEAE